MHWTCRHPKFIFISVNRLRLFHSLDVVRSSHCQVSEDNRVYKQQTFRDSGNSKQYHRLVMQNHNFLYPEWTHSTLNVLWKNKNKNFTICWHSNNTGRWNLCLWKTQTGLTQSISRMLMACRSKEWLTQVTDVCIIHYYMYQAEMISWSDTKSPTEQITE